jgi:hypothetical protein
MTPVAARCSVKFRIQARSMRQICAKEKPVPTASSGEGIQGKNPLGPFDPSGLG